MLQAFLERKESEKFNQDLIDATNGYCQLAQIGLEGGRQIFKLVINPDAKKTVCFIAGLHGNEKAGPYGILEFLKTHYYIPETRRVILIPLVNPVGFNKNTRLNAEDEDVNRHFLDKNLEGECKVLWDSVKDENIELLHTLHEDLGTDGFYCYYTHNKHIAEELKQLAKKYFKIFDKERRQPLEDDYKSKGDKIINGLVPLPHTVTGTIEDKFLLHRATPYIVTETPGKAPFSDRVEFTKKAIKLVINTF